MSTVAVVFLVSLLTLAIHYAFHVEWAASLPIAGVVVGLLALARHVWHWLHLYTNEWTSPLCAKIRQAVVDHPDWTASDFMRELCSSDAPLSARKEVLHALALCVTTDTVKRDPVTGRHTPGPRWEASNKLWIAHRTTTPAV